MNSPIENHDRQGSDHFGNALELVLHDLQQPLHAARLRVETLALRWEQDRGLLSPAVARQEMEPLRAALEDMQGLLDSVLTVLGAETGGDFSARAEPADLRDLLVQTLQPFRDRAAQAGVRLCLSAEPPLPELHWLHRQIRCHVLNNLLANALQVSPRGALIQVNARAFGDLVEIRVSDEGPGMIGGLGASVFQRHRRGSASAGDGHLGLGLYSAQLFTRVHKGELYAEDAKGRGATLVLRLPARPFGEPRSCSPATGRAKTAAAPATLLPDAGLAL